MREGEDVRDDRCADDAGVTLIEVLISFVVMGFLATSIALGVGTAVRAGKATNTQARADAMVTGFGEVLKQVEYVPCATPNDYEAAFTSYEGDLPTADRLAESGGAGAELEVVTVDSGSRCGEAIDAGAQVINIKATVRDRTRTAQIVKRDPDAAPSGPFARIDPEVRQSAPGDFLFVVALTATSSVVPAGVLQLEWDCGLEALETGGFERRPVTYELSEPALCAYSAGAADRDVEVSVLLTDNRLEPSDDTEAVLVPAAGGEIIEPEARITLDSQTSSSGVTTGSYPLNTLNPSAVVVNGSESTSAPGTTLTYSWTFGDPSSGALNTSQLVRPQHVFAGSGTFSVSLTVTDDYGQTDTVSLPVVVNPSGRIPPTVSFTATPSTGIAPQSVAFNASASTAALGGPLTYAWDFGDATTGTGVAPSHVYPNPGTYTVTLTATDSLGNSASTARSVTFGPLANPAGFVMYDAEGEFFDDGRFRFSWVNSARSPGDQISYEIRVWGEWGCVAFGDKTRTVASSGTGGTSQTYTWVTDWPASNVCLWSTYGYRVRTKRVTAGGDVYFSSWSAAQFKYVDHT